MEKNKGYTTKTYELNGVVKTLPQWAREYGIEYYTLRSRVNGGMKLAEALTKPVARKPQTVANAKRKCRQCAHGWYVGGNVWGCQYILDKMERRGCPVIGCTKFEPGKHKRTNPLGAQIW